jgi:hypothetical protein
VVRFGVTAGTAVTVVSDNQLRITAPAGSGTVAATLTTPGGGSTTSAATAYTYLASPTITGLTPSWDRPLAETR